MDTTSTATETATFDWFTWATRQAELEAQATGPDGCRCTTTGCTCCTCDDCEWGGQDNHGASDDCTD